MSVELEELYQEVILDHSRRPRNFGVLANADVLVHGDNPACGDEIHLGVRFGTDGRLQEIRFSGQGCAISLASASMMTTKLKGKSRAEATEIGRAFQDLVTGAEAEQSKNLGNLQLLQGVRKFPQRVKCAMLAWRAVEQAMAQTAGEATVSTEAESESPDDARLMVDTQPLNIESRSTRSLARICEEPFRIFFPAGALLGVVGVSLWVLFYLGAGVSYPNVAHARLMIEGLMASFIFGFLGTAGPRLTSAPHFSLTEIVIVFTLDLLAAGAHTGGAHRLGDICFVICLLLFARMLLRRFRQRKDNPPPNFILVALGLLSGIIGAALVAYSEDAQYSRAYQAGSALLNECFVLLPILGVAPFFIGRLLDLPGSDLPESRAFSREWKRQAAFNALIGGVIVASFLLEGIGPSRAAAWIRAAAIVVYLAGRMPWRGRTFLADYLRAGLLFILAGFTMIALWPNYRIGSLHTVFITGFNLIVLTVATRVVLGHSGNLDRLKTRLWFFIFMSAFFFFAMASRVTADLAPRARIVHLVAAAICWLAASLIWMIKVLPKVTISEPE